MGAKKKGGGKKGKGKKGKKEEEKQEETGTRYSHKVPGVGCALLSRSLSLSSLPTARSAMRYE